MRFSLYRIFPEQVRCIIWMLATGGDIAGPPSRVRRAEVTPDCPQLAIAGFKMQS